jgi:hypothetical protein
MIILDAKWVKSVFSRHLPPQHGWFCPHWSGTKRLLGKQPSHQNSASLFLTFVAETSQERTQFETLNSNLAPNCEETRSESFLGIHILCDYIITSISNRGSRVIDRLQQSSNFVVASVYKRLEEPSTSDTAAIKKYYPRKMALELLCTIYGPNITLEKITAIARILSVKVPWVKGWILLPDKDR